MTGAKALFFFFAAIHVCFPENKFMTAVRNLDQNNNNGTRNNNIDEDNALKIDFLKYLKECNSDGSGEDEDEASVSDEDFGSYGKRNHGGGSRGTYPEFYGDTKYRNNRRKNSRNEQNWNRDLNSQGDGNDRLRENYNWQNRPIGSQNGYDRSMGTSNKNRQMNDQHGENRRLVNRNFKDFNNRSPTGPIESQNGYDRWTETSNNNRSGDGQYGQNRGLLNGNFKDFNNRMPIGPMGRQNDDDRSMGTSNNNQPVDGQYGESRRLFNGNFNNRMSNPNYPTGDYYGGIPPQYRPIYRPNGRYTRKKRSNNEDNCVSQCVFGYLDVLDDDRVPSETALIKYLQDHVPNDGKRIQYLRNARRCFAQLATTNNEDGCGFSNMLSKCLKLDVQ